MTRNRVIWWLALLLMLAGVCLLENHRQQVAESAGLQALERMVEVKGHIRHSSHQGAGQQPVPGSIVVFQRVRDDQMVAVRVDSDGYYEVFLERGRYRVIVPKMNANGTRQLDTRAASWERYIDIEKSSLGVHFDIEIAQEDL